MKLKFKNDMVKWIKMVEGTPDESKNLEIFRDGSWDVVSDELITDGIYTKKFRDILDAVAWVLSKDMIKDEAIMQVVEKMERYVEEYYR